MTFFGKTVNLERSVELGAVHVGPAYLLALLVHLLFCFTSIVIESLLGSTELPSQVG